MYMPFLCYHPNWLASKHNKKAAWKENRKKSKATGKRKAPDADPASDAAPTEMSLSKTFKYALTSKFHLYDQEADLLLNEAEKAAAAGSSTKS